MIKLLILTILFLSQVKTQDQDVAFGWNAFISKSSGQDPLIYEQGLYYWQNSNSVISVYFYVNTPGAITLKLRSVNTPRMAELQVTLPQFNSMRFLVTFKALSNSVQTVQVGTSINVPAKMYVRVDIQGTANAINTKPGYYPQLDSLLVGGASSSTIYYVHRSFSSHFGRRGPSVHFGYQQPSQKLEWFYNEVTVPQGYDTIGTYAMAIGFGEGYFGMQVNSATERRILFSVWSPQQTDDKNQLTADNLVKLVESGPGVVINIFEGEGSGGQSYLLHPWATGVPQRFWVRVQPQTDNTTIYSGYFYDQKAAKWILIAKFKRPYTQTYLTGPYSFLENFNPETGHIVRRALFGNQWAVDVNKVKYNISTATFTMDETANSKNRIDYLAGFDGTRYYLQNCGFGETAENGKYKVDMYQQFVNTNASKKVFPSDFSAVLAMQKNLKKQHHKSHH